MHDIRPVIPELFTHPGTLLYIGARIDAHSWLDELIEAGHDITIVEVWSQNVIGLSDYPGVAVVKQGDVRDINEPYDYTVWWHGPEHLPYHEIGPTLLRLEGLTRLMIAVACPWGVYPQGAHEGNPFEEHQTSLYPDYFERLGYHIKTDGKADTAGSEIVAWKRL